MQKLKESITEAKKVLREAEIDKEKVTDAANKVAKKVFGDKTDPKKVSGMVDKAIGMAKDTQDAIGIVQGFFQAK